MRGTKGLFGLVVGLGLLILAGFGVVVATLAHRMLEGSHSTAAAAAPTPVTLDEPSGTRIGTIIAAGDRLAVLLQGGGAGDRLVLLDPHDGTRVGTVLVTGPAPGLAPAPPP